jgi:acyl-CoA thioester hydrolase
MKIEPVKIQVRFVDVDLMGHVNNAVYLSYFENARMHYFKEMLGSDWDWGKDGIILLKNEVEYLKPVLLNDTPKIKIVVVAIGTKSFTLGYELTVNGVLYCKGLSILVSYNNRTKKSIAITPVMRTGLENLKLDQ